MKGPLLALIAFLTCSCSGSRIQQSSDPVSEPIKRPNVLLICIDDLRPELGCYGVPEVQSPQLDAFAETALRFDRHYVQFPTCGASRYSFLTGRRPSQPAHYGNGAFATLHELSEGEEPVATLPAVFHQAGYRTVGLGKISHSHDGRMRSGKDELPDAWDALPTDAGPWGEARHLLHGYANGVPRVAGKSPITESEDVPDDGYPDARLASQAIEELRVLASGEAPFFLAVGFFKPHLPFAAPRSYWDLYDPNNLPRSTQPDIPEDLPSINGWGQSGEVTGNYAGAGFDDATWSIEERRHLRHGYYACVSYVDAQVGRLLSELDSLGLAEETIVVVWGDHGWHLGDLGLFGKHTTYEAALRSTLLVRAPGRSTGGTSTRALVESLDVFPTLTELCGLRAPDDLPGRSFTQLLGSPELEHRDVALSYWRRGPWIATSMRTPRYRLVGWSDPVSNRQGAIEFYDLDQQPEDGSEIHEEENLAVSEAALIRRLIDRHLPRGQGEN